MKMNKKRPATFESKSNEMIVHGLRCNKFVYPHMIYHTFLMATCHINQSRTKYIRRDFPFLIERLQIILIGREKCKQGRGKQHENKTILTPDLLVFNGRVLP